MSVDPALIVGLLIDGVSTGLALAILAVGVVLILGLAKVVNIAHGGFATLAAISAKVLMDSGLHPIFAILVAIVFVGVLSLLMDKVVLIPAYRLEGVSRITVGMLLTIGVLIIIHAYLTTFHPYQILSFLLPISTIYLMGVAIRFSNILAALISSAVITLFLWFLSKTMCGKSLRAIFQNELGGLLCGMDPVKMRSVIFVLGGMLGGLAGIIYGIKSSVEPGMSIEFTVLALIIATVGGEKSMLGTLTFGLILGVSHAILSFFVGGYITYLVFLIMAIVVILLRPQGLLGHML